MEASEEKQENENEDTCQPQVTVETVAGRTLYHAKLALAYVSECGVEGEGDALSAYFVPTGVRPENVQDILIYACAEHAIDWSQMILVNTETNARWLPMWELPSLLNDHTVFLIVHRRTLPWSESAPDPAYLTNKARVEQYQRAATQALIRRQPSLITKMAKEKDLTAVVAEAYNPAREKWSLPSAYVGKSSAIAKAYNGPMEYTGESVTLRHTVKERIVPMELEQPPESIKVDWWQDEEEEEDKEKTKIDVAAAVSDGNDNNNIIVIDEAAHI